MTLTNDSVANVYPMGMGSSEIVLQSDDDDDEGHINSTVLDELPCNELGINPTAINIENSSDVIIGPVTQFMGPVTIYQNVNAPIENNRLDDKNGRLVKAESAVPELAQNKKFRPNPTQIKILSCAALCVIVLITVIPTVIFLGRSDTTGPADRAEDSSSGRPRGPGAFISRKVWGGRPPQTTRPLSHPTPLVIIAHTVTNFCKSISECSAIMQSVQAYHVSRGSPDVGYNFLIGGDGNIYVARGWDVVNFAEENSIIISFIGNFVFDELTKEMIDSAKMLLDRGMAAGILGTDYKLVGHNQTFATESPGKNVYKIIKTWPHFIPDEL